MRLEELVAVSAKLAETPGRLEKISTLAALLTRVPVSELPTAIGFLIGAPRQGKLGVGWATVAAARESTPAAVSSLELSDVDHTFDRIQSAKGKSSGAERARLVSELFARARADEQQFLGALIVGEVRHGALETTFRSLAEFECAIARLRTVSGLPTTRLRYPGDDQGRGNGRAPVVEI